MPKFHQIPPVLLAQAFRLWLSGRVHFRPEKLGKSVQDDEQFIVFRQVVVDPLGNQPKSPGAILKVCFHYAKFSTKTNKKLSLIPIPFIVAQPGFRSKTWLLGQETGITQGYCP